MRLIISFLCGLCAGSCKESEPKATSQAVPTDKPATNAAKEAPAAIAASVIDASAIAASPPSVDATPKPKTTRPEKSGPELPEAQKAELIKKTRPTQMIRATGDDSIFERMSEDQGTSLDIALRAAKSTKGEAGVKPAK